MQYAVKFACWDDLVSDKSLPVSTKPCYCVDADVLSVLSSEQVHRHEMYARTWIVPEIAFGRHCTEATLTSITSTPRCVEGCA